MRRLLGVEHRFGGTGPTWLRDEIPDEQRTLQRKRHPISGMRTSSSNAEPVSVGNGELGWYSLQKEGVTLRALQRGPLHASSIPHVCAGRDSERQSKCRGSGSKAHGTMVGRKRRVLDAHSAAGHALAALNPLGVW